MTLVDLKATLIQSEPEFVMNWLRPVVNRLNIEHCEEDFSEDAIVANSD